MSRRVRPDSPRHLLPRVRPTVEPRRRRAPDFASVPSALPLDMSGRAPGRARSGDPAAFAAFLGTRDVRRAIRLLLRAGGGEARRLAVAWRTHMQARDLGPARVRGRLACVGSLLRAARLADLVGFGTSENHADTFGADLGPARMPALLEAARGQPDLKKAARDEALVRLVFDLALGCDEVAALRRVDLDLAAGRLWVRRAGSGARSAQALPLPRATCSALAEWIYFHDRDVRPDVATPLFPRTTHPRGVSEGFTGAGVRALILALGTRGPALRIVHAGGAPLASDGCQEGEGDHVLSTSYCREV